MIHRRRVAKAISLRMTNMKYLLVIITTKAVIPEERRQ